MARQTTVDRMLPNMYMCLHLISSFLMFHFQFLDPLSSFSVGYKSESNDANDSKQGDLSQLIGI